MPRCFVERCHNYGGKRLNIILHSFPNNLDKIRLWLRCIERSGHVMPDIEELAERIFQGKTNNRFRVCSEHFTQQSYQPSGLRKTLRKDAVPTIFRDVPRQKSKAALEMTHEDQSAGGEPLTTSHIHPSIMVNQPGGQANTATTVKNVKETREGSSWAPRRADVTHVILKITLDIICLLTGEDYIVVKKTSREEWSKTQGHIVEPRSDSLMYPDDAKQKILELTSEIMELLSAEKCDPVDVGMDSRQALSSLDNMANGLDHPSYEEKEDTSIATDHRRQDMYSDSYDGRNITDHNSSTDDSQQYPSPAIKEEPCDEENLTDPEIRASVNPQEHGPARIKEEPVSCGDLTDADVVAPTGHRPSLAKVEPVTIDSAVYTSPANVTGTTSSDGGSPTDVVEPVLCDGGRLRHTYTQAQQSSTRMECEDVHSDYSTLDKGSIDTDIYALIKHAQAKYTFTRIGDGSSSEEEENSKDLDPPTTADHARPRPPNAAAEAVPQTFHCPDCSEIFTRKSGLINHRRNHRREKLTCSKCGKVFSKRSSLQNHLTLHTGEKPYACPICGKCFARKSNLISHETIHSGKASYTCAECGRYFVCKVHLTKHQIIHEK